MFKIGDRVLVVSAKGHENSEKECIHWLGLGTVGIVTTEPDNLGYIQVKAKLPNKGAQWVAPNDIILSPEVF